MRPGLMNARKPAKARPGLWMRPHEIAREKPCSPATVRSFRSARIGERRISAVSAAVRPRFLGTLMISPPSGVRLRVPQGLQRSPRASPRGAGSRTTARRAQQARDPGERLQVRRGLVGRREDQEDRASPRLPSGAWKSTPCRSEADRQARCRGRPWTCSAESRPRRPGPCSRASRARSSRCVRSAASRTTPAAARRRAISARTSSMPGPVQVREDETRVDADPGAAPRSSLQRPFPRGRAAFPAQHSGTISPKSPSRRL